MTRATLLRVLLAVALATATGLREGQTQTNFPSGPSCDGPCPIRGGQGGPGQDSGSNKNVIWYIVGGVVIGVVGWLIANQPWADPPPSPPPPQPPLPPSQPPVAQLQTNPSTASTSSQSASRVALRPTCNLPAVGETRFVPTEVIVDVPANVSAQALDGIAARHAMTQMETTSSRLTGRRLHRWHIDGGSSVEDMIRNVCADRAIAGVQPNYVFSLAQEEQEPVNGDQYAPEKLSLPEAHRLAKGSRVLVAVIDSEVDASHPELAGAIVGNFEAATDDEKPHPHGTGMAGAIAARRTMVGTAPRVGLLTVRAFSSKANSAEGTTFNIIKGLDWAAAQGARVVNMSFAGPPDPRLRDALQKANQKGMVLIAAAGNAGPRSPPLFPAADPNVIAVTATDSDDAIFSGANRGDHIAVAAPGVDILAPAPDGTYQFTTGTSVAAAEVSGVVALLIERNPALTPADVRRILMATAKDLGPKGRDRDFGAGLVNALQAVTAAKPVLTSQKPVVPPLRPTVTSSNPTASSKTR
jgi:subtilisin family serine protease